MRHILIIKKNPYIKSGNYANVDLVRSKIKENSQESTK